ncbi:hypothetical protein PUN28_019751 [Cardiocondyla obscurior]|uniref:Uncharacterized protein n=1 Tax=Cardiocondyla obscurior TaxID=286306 RepID=A0AAW2EA08_9HYME
MNRPTPECSIDAEEEIVRYFGIAGRFPESVNIQKFKENLMNKVDLGSSNHGRWNHTLNMPGRIGKINNVEKI